MPLNFKPLSEKEIMDMAEKPLLLEGTYPFIIKEAKQDYSKSNNPMFKLRIAVLASHEDERNIFDYLLTTGKMMFKLKHFCEAIGLQDSYNKGTLLAEDCLNRSGKVKIGIQKGNIRPDGSGFYPDKNNVIDYIVMEQTSKSLNQYGVLGVWKNNDIPF